MTEEVHTINIQEGGQWKTIIPHMAEAAVKDGTGQTITLTYATKRELTDGSVTKLGKITVGGANRPIYLLNGVPTVADKVATTDTDQTFDGSKTFGKTLHIVRKYGDSAITIERNDYVVGDVVNNIQLGDVSWMDKNRTTYGSVDTYINKQGSIAGVSTPYTRMRMMLKQPNGGTSRGLEIYNGDNGSCVISIPTVPTNATSATVVNKGYVESTDGVTNNLVHRSADESIKGIKKFESATVKAVPLRRRTNSTYVWQKMWTNEVSSNGGVLVFLAGFVNNTSIITVRRRGVSNNPDIILSAGFEPTATPYVWNFAVSRDANGVVTIWSKITDTSGATAIGYSNVLGDFKVGAPSNDWAIADDNTFYSYDANTKTMNNGTVSEQFAYFKEIWE